MLGAGYVHPEDKALQRRRVRKLIKACGITPNIISQREDWNIPTEYAALIKEFVQVRLCPLKSVSEKGRPTGTYEARLKAKQSLNQLEKQIELRRMCADSIERTNSYKKAEKVHEKPSQTLQLST
jgi:hypothetical protein